MNLIEAIKSGKRFRRKDTGFWLSIQYGGFTDIHIQYLSTHNRLEMGSHSLTVEELLAEDWEVEDGKTSWEVRVRSSGQRTIN